MLEFKINFNKDKIYFGLGNKIFYGNPNSSILKILVSEEPKVNQCLHRLNYRKCRKWPLWSTAALKVKLDIVHLLHIKRTAALNGKKLRLSSNFKGYGLTGHLTILNDLRAEVISLEMSRDVMLTQKEIILRSRMVYFTISKDIIRLLQKLFSKIEYHG